MWLAYAGNLDMPGCSLERTAKHFLLALDIPNEIRNMLQRSKTLHVEVRGLDKGHTVPLG